VDQDDNATDCSYIEKSNKLPGCDDADNKNLLIGYSLISLYS